MATVWYWSRPVLLGLGCEGWTGTNGQHTCLEYRYELKRCGNNSATMRKRDVMVRGADNCTLQALAAVGQCRLMSLWDNLFSHLRVPVAQILLTRNDIADVRYGTKLHAWFSFLTPRQRTQYINAQNTFEQLFEMGVVPIVNENDTLAVSVRKCFSDPRSHRILLSNPS